MVLARTTGDLCVGGAPNEGGKFYGQRRQMLILVYRAKNEGKKDALRAKEGGKRGSGRERERWQSGEYAGVPQSAEQHPRVDCWCIVQRFTSQVAMFSLKEVY